MGLYVASQPARCAVATVPLRGGGHVTVNSRTPSTWAGRSVCPGEERYSNAYNPNNRTVLITNRSWNGRSSALCYGPGHRCGEVMKIIAFAATVLCAGIAIASAPELLAPVLVVGGFIFCFSCLVEHNNTPY